MYSKSLKTSGWVLIYFAPLYALVKRFPLFEKCGWGGIFPIANYDGGQYSCPENVQPTIWAKYLLNSDAPIKNQ